MTQLRSHLPYGISQCNLLPDTSEHTPPYPQPCRPVLDLPTRRRDGRLRWPGWLDSAPATSRTSDLSITSLTLNHCTNKTTIGNVRDGDASNCSEGALCLFEHMIF